MHVQLLQISYRLANPHHIEGVVKSPTGVHPIKINWSSVAQREDMQGRAFGLTFGPTGALGSDDNFIYFRPSDADFFGLLKDKVTAQVSQVNGNPVTTYLAAHELCESLVELTQQIDGELSPRELRNLCRRVSSRNSFTFELRRQLGKLIKL